MIAGSDIENGFANSLTDTFSFLAQTGEQSAPRWIGERGKSAVEVRF